MKGLQLLATGGALPNRVVTNEDLRRQVDTSDEWIRTRTGIAERRVLNEESVLSLAREASLRALENAGLDADDIDMIIVSTAKGETVTPATANLLQGEIGAHCPAFDVNAACSGFLYALDLVQPYIDSGKAKRILITCAEAISRLCDWTDRSTCVLFGDGAGAAIVGPGEGLLATRLTSTPNLGALNAYHDPGNNPFQEHKHPASYLHMAGQEVFKFAVSTSSADLRAVAEAAGIGLEEIDLFVLHQANMRILEAVRTRLGLPKEKFPSNIARTGNTSSASVPILLDELNRSGALKPGMLIAMSAFGAGLTSGAALLRWAA